MLLSAPSPTLLRLGAGLPIPELVRRLRAEDGFGLLELLIAMIVLNIGIFALVGTFNAGTVAVGRAGSVASATALAEKQMETYRSLENCAIWLDQWLIPAAGTTYATKAAKYNGAVAYWSTSTPANDQYWATDGQDGQAGAPLDQPSLGSCAYTFGTPSYYDDQSLPLPNQGSAAANLAYLNALYPSNPALTKVVTPPESAVIPEQSLAGPDGATYTVDTYIVLVEPSAGEWTKQVSVVVYDPHNSARVLASDVSIFDPASAP
jgi:type II secretory pathway pseudopilin PulG